jgi:KDO2-lipid IV(A) lauroyltransferase
MSSLLVQTRKRLKRLTLVVLTKLIRVLAWVVPHRAAVAIGAALGYVAYYLIPRDRKRAIAHLSMGFPDRSSQWVMHTARGVFIHLGKALLEVLSIRKNQLASLIAIDGLDRLDAALKMGKGVVYFTGHIGNWELMAARIAQKYPVSVVAAPIKPESLNDMIVGLRTSMGVRTILRDRPGAARELIRIFRENRILGILIDQDTDVEGAFVDFFRRPAWTPTAAAAMAIKFNAPVLFGHIRREGTFRHRITIEGPLELARSGDEDNDIKENTSVFTTKIEEIVSRYPDQWVWMHRRWRRQP